MQKLLITEDQKIRKWKIIKTIEKSTPKFLFFEITNKIGNFLETYPSKGRKKKNKEFAQINARNLFET